MANLRLIVGLGNPGTAYAATRHNIGAACVCNWAARFAVKLAPAHKVKGQVGRGSIAGVDVRLLLPGCYMNHSGQVVGPYARYYGIEPAEILVAHDEVAFAPGVVRLKTGGGDNGHNGIRSLLQGLGSGAFHRLRIGVGHPGDKEQMVRYLTQTTMPQEDRDSAAAACRLDDALLDAILHGRLQLAMNQLHGVVAEPP